MLAVCRLQQPLVSTDSMSYEVAQTLGAGQVGIGIRTPLSYARFVMSSDTRIPLTSFLGSTLPAKSCES